MLGVHLFRCSQILGSLLLVCAVLKTLHTVKCILNEEKCRSVGKASYWWWDALAVVIIVKPPGACTGVPGCVGGIQGRLVL